MKILFSVAENVITTICDHYSTSNGKRVFCGCAQVQQWDKAKNKVRKINYPVIKLSFEFYCCQNLGAHIVLVYSDELQSRNDRANGNAVLR